MDYVQPGLQHDAQGHGAPSARGRGDSAIVSFQTYYQLTKPGIIYGNALPAIAGFLLASEGKGSFGLLLATLLGISLVIACGCVYNNYIDRGIDQHMQRTKGRALAAGTVSGRHALIYATLLGLAGFAALAIFTNWLTVVLGVAALFFYVVVYGYAKRRSVHGTLVGSIPGAAAPVAGYTAVSSSLDLAALLLFLILVCWQMPHFYAIAIFRAKEYAAAGIPVLPVKKGIGVAKAAILGYIAAFTVVAVSLGVLVDNIGKLYVIVAFLLGAAWFVRGLSGLRNNDNIRWARGMFFFSLVVLTILCATLAITPSWP